MKKRAIIIFMVSICSVLFSQEFYGAGAFTEIGFSARSLALGNTMFSDSDPAVAIYFNPAVVTNRNRRSIHINNRTNNKYFGNHTTFGFYFPIKLSPKGIGFNFISYQVDEIEGYDDQANFLGNFDFKEYFGAIIFTSSLHNIAWGLKLSAIYNNISEYNESDYVGGIEIGTTYDLDLLKINGIDSWNIVLLPKIGFTGKRYFHPEYYQDHKNFIPSKLTIGTNLLHIDAYLNNFIPSKIKINKLPSIYSNIYYDLGKNYEFPAKSSLGFNIGVELEDIYSFGINMGRANFTREGYKGISQENLNNIHFDGKHLFFFNTLGFSLNINSFWISYSQTFHPYFNQTDYFSLAFNW